MRKHISAIVKWLNIARAGGDNAVKREINKVTYQLTSGEVDSDSAVLEFLDENEDPFMEITINKNDVHQIMFYCSDSHISIPLSSLIEGIEIAKRRVFNVDFEALDAMNSETDSG